MAEQPPEHCNNAESCDDGPPVARISFHTIDMLAEWLQTSLGDKSVAVGEALSQAFEEQARNAMGPKKPQPTPFSPPPALVELLDNLPHHMQMQQKVIHLYVVASSIQRGRAAVHVHQTGRLTQHSTDRSHPPPPFPQPPPPCTCFCCRSCCMR